LAEDPLAEVCDALIAAGVAPELVKRVINQARIIWGGGQVYIRAIDRQWRDQVIRRELEAGRPMNEVAAKAGTSLRTVARRKSEWF